MVSPADPQCLPRAGGDERAGLDNRCCCWTALARAARRCCSPTRFGCGPRDHEGGGPQAELLRRVAHWLMKEPALEEEALTATVDGGTLSVERRTTADTPPPAVTATSPGGQQSHHRAETDPRQGGPRGSLAAPDPGVWRVNDGTRTAFAAAGSVNPLEIADLRATAAYVGNLTRASGGSVHWLDPNGAPELRSVEPDRIAAGANWIGLRRNHDHLVTGVGRHPAVTGLGSPTFARGTGLCSLAARGHQLIFELCDRPR